VFHCGCAQGPRTLKLCLCLLAHISRWFRACRIGPGGAAQGVPVHGQHNSNPCLCLLTLGLLLGVHLQDLDPEERRRVYQSMASTTQTYACAC